MRTVFSAIFSMAAPFWALMILAPTWSWTRRIVSSPWIAAPPAVVYLLLVIPDITTILPAVASPSLDGIRDLLGTPLGATVGWAHFIAFDLFVGRWIYLDSRERRIHPLVTGPILLVTILLAPIGLLAYLPVRHLHRPDEPR
ncbi:ABA4-like family protein [Longispora sp. NPDC051575]|uniref:ABA4-like family protein n=1 Tax=Longispora sp. NPDC051575 TaxID=3154943 RepID=UPI00341FCFC3